MAGSLSNTIDIYYIDSNAMEIDASLVKILNKDEYQRYIRYLVVTARTEFLVGRYLLKTVISKYTNTTPQEIVFRKNEYGKLFLEANNQQEHITFSLAHSGGVVAGAFARKNDIGIDVEKIDKDISGIARRFFSPKEKAYLDSIPVSERNNLAYQIWTMKEAYIKAKGMGLSLPLEDFCVFDDLEMSFYTTRFLADYYLSLAIHNRANESYIINLYDLKHTVPRGTVGVVG